MVFLVFLVFPMVFLVFCRGGFGFFVFFCFLNDFGYGAASVLWIACVSVTRGDAHLMLLCGMPSSFDSPGSARFHLMGHPDRPLQTAQGVQRAL